MNLDLEYLQQFVVQMSHNQAERLDITFSLCLWVGGNTVSFSNLSGFFLWCAIPAEIHY